MVEFLMALSGAAIPIFLTWLLYFRKNKASAVGAEKNNDRTEIDNFKLIAQEWREAATQWKDLADETRTELIAERRRIESAFLKFEDTKKELESNRDEIKKLRAELGKAKSRIAELEKWEKLFKAQNKDGNK